jgi:hypothetical protein
MACISVEALRSILVGAELGGDSDAAYSVSYAVPTANFGVETPNNSGFSFGIIQLDIGVNGNAQDAYSTILNEALADNAIDQATFDRLIRYNGESRYDLDALLADDFQADQDYLNEYVFSRPEAHEVIDFYTNQDLSQRVLPKVKNFLGEMEQTWGGETNVFSYLSDGYHTAVAAIVSVVNRTNSQLTQSIEWFEERQPLSVDVVHQWFDELIVPTFGAIHSHEWSLIATGGETYSAFDTRLHPITETQSFAQAVSDGAAPDGNTLADLFLRSELGNCVSNVTYTGSTNAAFLVDSFQIAGAGIDFTGGLLLSSGAYPGPTNTDHGFSVTHNTLGDADLGQVATNAFGGAGETNDAAVLEFDLFLDDPKVDGLRFDIVFGSDEYPEFSNSSYVDVAAVFVNGDNKALFNGDPSTPLSVIDENLALNFSDNTGGTYPIEWDGFGAFSVRPALQQGQNHIKIGVADTGDYILDSAIYLTNFELLYDGATGDNPFKTVNGQAGQNDLVASPSQEEFKLAPGKGSVGGTLDALNGDFITGFDDLKILIFNAVELLADQVKILMGSAILQIDSDNDGTVDSTVTLEGDFTGAEFNVENAGGNTLITVVGAATVGGGGGGDGGSGGNSGGADQPVGNGGIGEMLAALVTPQQQENLIKLAVGMFGAAPGAVHLEDFAEYHAAVGAAAPGANPLLGLANTLAATPTFQSSRLYPSGLTDDAFASGFVDNLVGDAVSDDPEALAWASGWMANLLGEGFSRGDAAYSAIAALDAVPHGNGVWGEAAQAFDNKVAVAEYYSVELGGNAMGLGDLQAVLADVGADTDVSTPQAIEDFLVSVGVMGIGLDSTLAAGIA